MHAALHDHVAFGLGGQTRQLQAVAHHIGHPVEDFGSLIIMGQNHRIALLLDAVDGVDIGGVERPFDRGNDILQTLVNGGGFAFHRRGPRDLGHVDGGPDPCGCGHRP